MLSNVMKSYLINIHFQVETCGGYKVLDDPKYQNMAEELYHSGYLGWGEEGYYLTYKGLKVVDQEYGCNNGE